MEYVQSRSVQCTGLGDKLPADSHLCTKVKPASSNVCQSVGPGSPCDDGDPQTLDDICVDVNATSGPCAVGTCLLVNVLARYSKHPL